VLTFGSFRKSLCCRQEYQRNPGSLGAREWTPVATWRLREFNELNHFFERRKTLAKRYTDEYLDQFPKDKTAQLARFVSFLAGSALAVLGLVTVIDSELFLGFELGGRTTLFWLGTLGAIWNISRGMIPADDVVHDPEFWIERVIDCTHYKPKSWEGKLYSEEVLRDMSSLYKLEIFLFLQELASVIFVPIIFWWRLPDCAEQLVDFFREFTIHVDGLGHVCSFAVFDFKAGNQTAHRAAQNPGELRADYFGARDNKLAESYQTFMLDYGDAPRKGLGNRHKRGQFHLPPVFPGLAASRMQRDLAQSMHYTPRMGPAASVAHGTAVSPMHSVLLDPHHQPRQSPRQGPSHLRQRGIGTSRLQTLDGDPDEHDEDDARPMPRRTPSNILEEDSELGDSWAVKADAGIAGSGNNGSAKKAENDGVGVLGLLYQFQKAQTEGRAGNI
jgi:autophagy-related protein 9